MARIAGRLRIKRPVVSQVVARRYRSRRVEEQIALAITKALGREVSREEIFGPPGRKGMPAATRRVA